jgi:hypothetical protein
LGINIKKGKMGRVKRRNRKKGKIRENKKKRSNIYIE